MLERFKGIVTKRQDPDPVLDETFITDAEMKQFLSMGLGSSLLFGRSLPESLWGSVTPEIGRVGSYATDPSQHTVVMGIVRLLGNAMSGTEFELRKRDGDGGDEAVGDDHPLMELLHYPNPTMAMTWRELAISIMEGLICVGSAYLLPKSMRELEYLDWRYVIPPNRAQMYYQYRNPWTDNIAKFGLRDIIHLRWQRGPDGINGIGPLRASALKEITTDATAQEYTDTILRRLGVPGVIVTPADEGEQFGQQAADQMMRAIDSSYVGGNRGRSAVMNRRLKFTELAGALQKADLRALRWVPEERICTSCGVPPALLNIGTGSEQSRVGATVEQLLRQYWTGTVQPTMYLIAEQLTTQLMPRYVGGRAVREYFLKPDFSQSTVLSDLRAEMRKRQLEAAVYGYKNGLMGFEEAREEAGLPPDAPPDLLSSMSGATQLTAGNEGDRIRREAREEAAE